MTDVINLADSDLEQETTQPVTSHDNRECSASFSVAEVAIQLEPLPAATSSEPQAALVDIPTVLLHEATAKLASSNPAFERALAAELLGKYHSTGAVATCRAVYVHCKEEFDPCIDRNEEECAYHPRVTVSCLCPTTIYRS
jgi:hypothetical protein